jgi:hypothetical protein
MIEYLKNDEIDRDKWDACIKNSHQLKPYGYSWYLDCMSPGWQALVDDDYDSVFPIPSRKKFGINYIATPIFLQQLGAFSPDKPSDEVLMEFLQYLPEFYKLIDLYVAQRIESDGFRVTENYNFELDMARPYEELWKGFSSDCRRNISIAVRNKPELSSDIPPLELIDLFRNNTGFKMKGIKRLDYERLSNLMTYCIENNCGNITGVRASEGKLIFGLFSVKTKRSITLLFTANSSESREKRIGYYVVNEIIKENAATRTKIDFAGSSVPSIASFMESFGSVRVPYYRIYQNRLFWPVKMLK